jgi:hypothetical protein
MSNIMIRTSAMQTIAWYTLAAGIPLAAQTQVDLRTQSKSVDFTGARSTKPFKSGGALPATCAQGEMFFLTAASAGTNLYGCTATNTWTLETGGAGGTVQVQNTGTAVGARPILDLSSGPGVLLAISDTGQSIAIQTSLDTSLAETSGNEQSGAPLLCASASGSATAYTCAMSPTLTSYTTGMILHWKPDVSGTGGTTTLNVDTLGAVAMKTADGTTNPAAADIVAGRVLEIWYDGASFRLLGQTSSNEQSGVPLLCAPASGSAAAYTCAMSPTLKNYSTGMILHWEPDVSGTGSAATLNVDTLGAVPVKLADGATNPGLGDVVAGRVLEIWYDGASFRLLGSPVPAGILGDAQPACAATVRGRLWFVAGAAGVKDGLSVCAKDATNAYAWRTIY